MKYFYSDYLGKSYQYGEKYNLKKGQKPGWNDEIDAFRHCFSQALLTLKFSEGFAKKFGTVYEMQGDIFDQQKPKERNMDQWNNAIGREIAKNVQRELSRKKYTPEEIEDFVAEKVMEKMRKGELITDPADTRKFNERTFKDKIFDIKNRVFHRGEDIIKDLANPKIRDIFLDQAFENKQLPTKEELDERVKTGELVYVSEYTRGDGTKVSGYYRAYPNS